MPKVVDLEKFLQIMQVKLETAKDAVSEARGLDKDFPKGQVDGLTMAVNLAKAIAKEEPAK